MSDSIMSSDRYPEFRQKTGKKAPQASFHKKKVLK